MREIKFRAWDNHTKTFISFDLGKPIFDDTENSVTFECSSVLGERDPDGTRFAFQQYTGLKDMNGKEIYEGDVVEHYGGIGLVEMKNGSWCLTYDTNPKDLAFGKPDLLVETLANLSTDDQTPSAVVIGNIYENPELLA